MKRIVAVIVLAVAVSMTVLPFVSGSPAVYADEGGGDE
jgi:hypothetical protein